MAFEAGFVRTETSGRMSTLTLLATVLSEKLRLMVEISLTVTVVPSVVFGRIVSLAESHAVLIGAQMPLTFVHPSRHSQPPLVVLMKPGMHATSCGGSRHVCEVALPITSVNDASQRPVKGRRPDADDALSGTGANGLIGDAWRWPSAMPFGRPEALIVVPRPKIMPLSALLAGWRHARPVLTVLNRGRAG